MPELPEVETVCRGLAQAITGKTISTVKTTRPNLRIPFPANLDMLEQQSVIKITRRAKYVLIHTDKGDVLIFHLGMSGRMTITDQHTDIQKHDHFIIDFSDGQRVIMNDARRFGMVYLEPVDNLENHRVFSALGIEPLSDDFNAESLFILLKNKKIPIKSFLLDQKNVVGVGNIYACEALHMAAIHPERLSDTITKSEASHLCIAIKDVLNAAINSGGSSLKDHRQTDGSLGYFQHNFIVYGRAGETCRTCQNNESAVQRIIQAGRSTFFCPTCQRK